MRVISDYSHGTVEFIEFAFALVHWIDHDRKAGVPELERICQGIWPGCKFYHGGTHTRVMPFGNGDAGAGVPSFYIDTTRRSDGRIIRPREDWCSLCGCAHRPGECLDPLSRGKEVA